MQQTWLKWLTGNIKIRLVAGPSINCTTSIEINNIAELLQLLTMNWPQLMSLIHLIGVESTEHESDLDLRINEAVKRWDDEFGEPEPNKWQWLGIFFYGWVDSKKKVGEACLTWELDMVSNKFHIKINADEIESRAFKICREIEEIGSKLLERRSE